MTDLSEQKQMNVSAFWRVLPQDMDATETKEWQEAFDQLVAIEGQERGTFILMKLLEQARRLRVPMPPVLNTPYSNTMILVHNSVAHQELNIETTLDITAVEVQLDRRYCICSIYLPPREAISVEDIERVLRQIPQPYMLLGDFNARHTLWGDSIINSHGRIIERVLLNNELDNMNYSEITHYHIQTNTETNIDLSLCSPNLILDLEWNREPCLYSSDHFPINIKVKDYTIFTNLPRFNIQKANWPLFRNSITCNREILNLGDISEVISSFGEHILTAAERAIPLKGGEYKLRPVPWWTPELKRILADKKAAYRRLRRTHLLTDKIEFNRLRAYSRYKIKEAKTNSWNNYIDSINQKTSIGILWKKMAKIKGKFTPTKQPILEENGTLITNPKEVSNKLGEHLSNISSSRNYTLPFSNYKNNKESRAPNFHDRPEIEEYNQEFNMEELKGAMKKTKNTSAGPDMIHIMMIRNLPENMIQLLLDIFNKIWTEHTFPTQWREATVLPFLKSGKDPKKAASYRPIALTSSICKLMERMVNNRLMWLLESRQLIHQNQYGFRKDHSTSDVLVRVETEIRESMVRNEKMVAVFFDIEKAYDTTWKRGIIEIVTSMGINGRMTRFLWNFLSDRTFRVKIGNTLSDPYEQEEGVPQGSVLSVTCFALAINSLPDCAGEDVKCSLYVDDFLILYSSRNFAALERKLQTTLNRITKWTEKTGYKFSTDKTEVVNFHRGRDFREPDLRLNGIRLKVVQEKKFLGLFFDRKLTWVPHLRQLKQKCLQMMGLMKSLANSKFGADRTSMLRVYKATVRAKLDYGCQAYSSARAVDLKMLDSVHHLGIRLSTGAFRSSPVLSLYADSGEPSLENRRTRLGLQLFCRLLRLPDSPSCKTVHDTDMDQTFNEKPQMPRPFGLRMRVLLGGMIEGSLNVMPTTYAIPPWQEGPDGTLCMDMHEHDKKSASNILRSLFMDHTNKHNHSNHIYTDGSKLEDGVGYAAVFPDETITGTLPPYTTICTAEEHAILAALKAIERRRGQIFTIFSDSMSALLAIEDRNHTSPLVAEIQNHLHRLHTRFKTVHFCWIPSHVDIAGNDKADKAAKEAAQSPRQVNCALPHKDYYPMIKHKLRRKWQDQWDQETNNKLWEIKKTIRP